MSYVETVYSFKTARFTLRLKIEDEYDAPDWDFEPGEKETLMAEIESGEMRHFIANVVVECDGLEIGSDYLGSCCYKSADEFRRDPYFRDMTRQAIFQARRFLANLPKVKAA